MAERPLYTLYKNLKAQNYDVPDDYNKFESALTRDGKGGADNRHAIYENLKAQNFDVPSTYERFYSALFEPRSKTSSRAKGGSVPMSAADRARFSAGAAAISASAQQTMNNAGRYNRLKQRKQKQQKDFGRVNLGTHQTPYGGDANNVVKDDFAYNPETGKTGAYVTSDNENVYSFPEAEQMQSILDKQNDAYQVAVDTGEIPSAFDVRDKNGNYDLQENIGKNGTYLTEEGAQKQFDKKLADAYARKKEIEALIAEDNRQHGNPLLSYGASIGAGNGRTAEQSDYRNKLATSLSLVTEQIGALEAVKQYPTSSWGEDALKALDNTAFTAKTWDFGLTDFAIMGQMERIKTKMDNNIPLSGSDKMLLKSKLGADAATALEDEKMGNVYRWTKIAGQSLPFMADFFLTGGYGGITKGISRGALKFAAKRGMGKVGAAILKNTGIVAGDVIGSYAMAGTEQALKTGADIMQRHLGNLYQDEKGDYKFGTFDENGNLLHEGGESIGTALYKGMTSAMVENYTEKLFGHNYGIKKGAVNFMEKHGMNASAEFFKNIGKSGLYTNAKKWMEKFGYNGYFEEVMEEEIGIPLHALLDGDNKFSDLLDVRQQLDIIGGMAISVGSMYAMGAGSRPVKGIYNRAQYYRFRNKVNVADSDAQNLMGDNWADIKDKIDNATNEQMGGVLSDILRQRDTMTKEQINAAVNYGVNLMKMRGYNIAKTAEMNAKEITNEPTTPEEQHQADIDNAYSEGHDADDADKHDIQIQQEDQMKSLAAALGISEQQLSAMSDEELESMTWQDDKLDQAIYNYQLSSARYQGVVDDAQDKVDLAAHQAEQRVDMYTDQSRGSVRNATIKASGGLEDYGVYIISGNVATHDDGSIDVSNSDDMILYYDPTTNSVEHADALMFAELGEELPADDVKAQAVADAKENAIKEVAGIIDGTVEVGSQFNVTDTDGTEHTYEVLADYGDGTAAISIDGNVVENAYSLADLQQMKDMEDQKRLEAAKAEREQMEKERAAQQTQETEQTQPSFDFNQILNDNGNVVLVDVLDKDGNTKYPDSRLFLIRDAGAKAKVVELKSDGTLVPHAVNKEDVATISSMSLDEYKQAMPESSMIEDNSGEESDEDSQLANLGLPKGSEIWMSGDGFGRPKENTLSKVVGIDEQGSIILEDKDGKKWSASFDYINNHRELPPLDENTNIVNEENNQSESNAEENTPAPEQTPAMTLEDGTIVPMLEDGNPDFSKLTAAQTAELYDSQFGEDADSIVSGYVSDAKKALDKASNMTVKGKTFVEQKAAKDAKEKAIADAQAAYDSAVAIRDAYNERQLAKVEDTAEGRKELIEKARRKFARLKSAVKDDAEAVSQLYRETIGSLLHRLYDGTGIDVTDTIPLTAEEYVASNLGAHSLNYEGTETSKGVKQETGLSREDFAKTQLLAADGKGTTIDALVHSLWENRPSNLESLDTQDIRNALIGVLNSGFKASEARNFVENIRIAQAENILEEQKRAQENAAYAEQHKAEPEAELKAKSDEKAELKAKSEAMLDNESDNESNDLDNETDNEKTNDKINDNINIPEDATDENPLGAERDESDLPFSAKENGKQQTTSERAADVEKNKVDDMKVVDNIVGQKTRKAFERLAKMMGANIQWQYSDKLGNGWIQETTDADGNVLRTIFITLDSSITKCAQFIFGHEMTHQIKKLNPAAYNELTQLVLDTYGSDAFDKTVDETMKRYSDAGFSGRARDYYAEEVVADAVGEMIRDLNLAHTLAMKMSHPLLAAIHEILQKIKLAFFGTEYSDVTKNIIRSIEQAYVKTANGEVINSETGEDVSFSLRQKPEPKKKGIGYKVFVLKDGKLYPPMVANPDGAATPVGVWLDADAAPIAGESKTGRPQVKQGGKGTQGGSGKLAYRPGWHLGVVPYAIQFNRKDADGNKTLFPKNFVFAEVEYAADVDYQEEARQEGINPSGKYQHSLAGLKHLPTDGYYMYRTNPNPETDPWVITGAMKVNRILTRTEQAELVKNAGREPQQIQEGDIVTDDVVNSINQEIADAPKFSLKVYHGSGADFTEFDFNHMGEGAGSQVFGWGGYVTSSKKIGKSYANIVDANAPHQDVEYVGNNAHEYTDVVAGLFNGGQRDYDDVKEFLLNGYNADKDNARKKQMLEWFESTKPSDWKSVNDGKRNLYEVDIPDDNGSNYLEWEKKPSDEVATKIIEGLYGLDAKTLDDMASKDIVFRTLLYDYIKNADKEQMIPLLVKTHALTKGTTYDNGNVEDDIRFVYNRLSRWMGSQKAASQFLSSLGFTGIKYPAGTIMGGAEEDDTNYVIFKPEDMRITEHTKFSLRLKSAIEETETNPSDAQKESGNYKKGHVKFGGYDYTIENPKGSTRSGKDADGKEWKVTMHDTYGYIRGKFGKDGDHLDMFINDKADLDNWNGDVFVVDQVNPNGSFDEHKVMYGYDSMDDAKKAYLANYSDGWQGLGNITGASKDEFDKWLDTSNRKLKPFADYAKVKFSLKSKPVRFEAGKELSDEEKKEVLSTLKDAYKVNGVPYHIEETAGGKEKRVYEPTADSYVVSDITNRPLRYYITLPDGRVAHPTEVYPNISDNEVKSSATKQGLLDDEADQIVSAAIGNMKDIADNAKAVEVLTELQNLPHETHDVGYGMNNAQSYNYKTGIFSSDAAQAIDYVVRRMRRKEDVPAEVPTALKKAAADSYGMVDNLIDGMSSTNFSLKDNQGNPLNQDGTLKLDKINSVDELTDEDFTSAFRNVELPAIPKNVDAAIGANGKPVVIKKNIFEKNWNAHKFTPAESKKVLNDALYNTDLVGHTQPTKKPNHWVAIKLDEKSPITVLEVNDNKDNVEVVGWYTLDERNLGRIKRQAERNGGELIMLTPKDDKVESLSTPPLSSAAKIDNSSETTKENGEKVDVEAPKTFDEFLNHPSLKFSIKNEEQRKAAEDAYEYASKLRPNKYAQYALVDMSNPSNSPQYYEKKVLADRWRRFYNKAVHNELDDVYKAAWGNYKLFDLDRPFADQVNEVKGDVPNEFNAPNVVANKNADNESGAEYHEYKQDEPSSITYKDRYKAFKQREANREKTAGLRKERKETEDSYNSKSKERIEYNKQLMKEYMDEHGLSSENDIPYDVWDNLRSKSFEKYQDELDSLFNKYKDLDKQIKAVAEPRFSLKDEKIKSVAEKFGVNEYDVAMYANAVEKGSTAEAARARANIKRYLLQANEDKISSFKELMKYTVPVNEALKENFGDLDAMIEERRKQVEAERNAMEAARKRAQEEEEKRQKHLDELSLIPTDELDKRYMDAIANNDESTAREMLDESARRNGYGDVDSDYQGQGAWAAPSNPLYESDEARRADIENSPDVNLEDIALGYSLQPDDYFDNPRAYMNNTAYGLESAHVIKNALDAIKNGEKDVKVKVYRAVPTSVKEGKLRNGDWVTPSKKYAEMHGDNRLEGKYRIIEDEVPANQLWWDGNDANEFGFDDGKEYRYKNAKNNRKLNDLITYDNKGNVIPPSKRFNSRKNDVRFSLAGERGAAAADKAEERTFRMDNISVAKDMEKNKKKAKAIKAATGWERGADGKWRYEMPDVVLRDPKEWVNKKTLTLSDIVEKPNDLFKEYPELFDAYPELKDMKIIKGRAKNGGVFYNNAITLNLGDIREAIKYDLDTHYKLANNSLKKTLVHEIQHYIQEQEGFAQGGNSEIIIDKNALDAIAKLRAEKDAVAKEFYAMSPEEQQRRKYEINNRYNDLTKQIERLEKSSRIGYDGYNRLSGEVEARNVSARLNMTPEDRRKTLAEFTEDVARKDQIFLGVGDVSFSLRDMADGKESGAADMAEDLKSLNTPDEVDDAIKTAIDDMPSGWKMANKKMIHIAQALGENRKAEIAGEEPKFSLKDGTLIKAGTYFSGGGLVEEGLKGIIDPVVAVEYDEKISGVYRNNFGQHIVTADVRDVDPRELVKQIDGEVEYFHASPVCKNYSQAKSNHAEVELDKETAASTAEFINAIKPKVVTIENVKGYKDSEAMKIITDALDANGYTWDADVYNAADYGGYTNRERLIVRAVRDGKLPEKPKKMEHKSGWYEAVADIIPTLTEKKNGVAPWMDVRLKADGIDWRNIDKPLYVMGSAYADGKVPHAFADELLPTLRTKSGDVIVMPDGKVYRAMGRVLARVSGVSDDYKMPFSENLSHTIIGNGIPTQLTEHVIVPLLIGSDPKFSIRTYHGTGASFDKFDLSHALEGEGSETFGHGVYVTNSKEIGGEYAKRGKENKISEWLSNDKNIPNKYRNNENVLDDYKHIAREIAYGKSLDELKAEAERSYKEETDNIKQKINVWEHGEENPRSYEIYFYQNDLEDTPENREKYRKETIDGYKEDLQLYDNMIKSVRGMNEEDFANVPRGFRYDVDIPDDNGSNYLYWEGKIPDSLDKQKVAEDAYNVVSDNQGFKDSKVTHLNNFIAHTLKTYVDATDVAASVEKLKSDIKDVIEDDLADDDVLALNEYLKDATTDDVLATIWYNDLVRDIYNAETGEELYRKLSTYVGDNAASQILSDNGLVGIKYPAGMIHGGAEEGDYNYVIFDENNANIVGNTRFSLRYDKFEHDLNQWKKDNNLPKDAQRPTIPQRNAGESAVDFLRRVDEYRKQMALWKTAPTYEQHLLSDDTALGEFNRELQRGSVLKRIAFQDSMLAIRKAQEAIMKEVGVDRLNMAEDAYTAENRSHGKGKNEFEEYNNEFLQPLRKAYHQMKKVLGDSYDNVRIYMMAKHGLERDAQMAFKMSLDADYEDVVQRSAAYKAYKGDMNRIINDSDLEFGRVDFNTWRQRDNALRAKYSPSYMNYRYDKNGIVYDYSGLSALFDGSDFEEAAYKLVNDIEDKYVTETRNLWDATNAATKKILRDGYKAGMMSKDTYQYVRDMYSHYIPLRGWDGTTADQVWDYVGGGKGAFNQTLKTAHGRTSIADDPIAYIENMAESGILLNNKNWVKQHLMLLAQNHPTSLLTLSKAWYVKSTDANGNEEWIPATPQITSQMNSNQVKAAIDAFEKKMEQMAQTGDATQKRDGLNIDYPQTHSEEREHEVRVMKDGEEYVIYVNGDPQLAQAMNNTRAHRVREIQSGKLDRAAAWLGRKMAAAYTSLSPLFIPSNYFRDLTMTMASTAIREDAKYNYLLRKNLATSWNLGFMLRDYQSGKLREKVSNGNATPKEQMFYDFMMNGGETGFVSSLDVEDLKKKFKNDLKDLDRWKTNPVKVGHTIMDSIEFLNRMIEDSNRFAVYMTSIQYGRSIDEAVNDAKDVTLNFNRKGTGEYGWQMIRNLYLFINPAVQSLQTLGALAKHHPFKFTAVTASWLASGVLVPIVNAALMSMLGGDDDKDKYWQFTKWDRRNNLIMWIPFTHEYIKIPLAQEFRAFYGIGDMIASKMMGGELAEESWSQYAEDLLGQVVDMLPLDPTGYDGNIAVSLMPNAIRPVFELAFNVDFTGKPLFKETEYNKYDPNFTKAYVGTPDWLVRASRMVNSIGNDYPDVQQNSIDAFGDPRYNLNNPAVVDHVLSSYLGGAYTMGSQVLGVLTKSLNDPKEIKVANIPLVSKFVSNPDDRPVTKKQGDEFWNMKENHDRAANTLSKLKKQAKVDGDYSMLERFYGSEEYKQYKQDDVKVKKYEEDKKKERAEESGEEYRPHKLNAEDIYKAHATPKDDFEDLKLKQLYTKLNGFKTSYDLLVDTAPSQSDAYYNTNKAAIDAIDEISLDKHEISELKKGFLDDGKDAYNAEDMKQIRDLRKKILAVLEKANKVVVANQKAKAEK